jgi:hypothetical protein
MAKIASRNIDGNIAELMPCPYIGYLPVLLVIMKIIVQPESATIYGLSSV